MNFFNKVVSKIKGNKQLNKQQNHNQNQKPLQKQSLFQQDQKNSKQNQKMNEQQHLNQNQKPQNTQQQKNLQQQSQYHQNKIINLFKSQQEQEQYFDEQLKQSLTKQQLAQKTTIFICKCKPQTFRQKYSLKFKSISKVKAVSITLGMNSQPQTFHIISYPRYQSLIYLQLAENNINNIENLAFINAPNLRNVGLSVNYIVSLKPFVKIFTRNIQNMTIQMNSFNSSQSLEYLSKTHLAQQCSQISLQSTSKSHISSIVGYMTASVKFDKPFFQQFNDLSYLIKVNSSFIKNLNLLKKTRIVQNKLLNCIKRKYQMQCVAQSTGVEFIKSIYVSMQG